MNLLTAEYGTRLYLASFAKVGNPYGEEQPLKLRLDANGQPILKGGTVQTIKGNQGNVHSLVKDAKRGAIQNLTPIEVDRADRNFKGRSKSLQLADPNALQRYATSPATPLDDRNRLAAAISSGQVKAPEDLLRQAIDKQKSATIKNDVTGTVPLSLNATQLAQRNERSAALTSSKDLDEFYSTINSGKKASAELRDKAKAALQQLTSQQQSGVRTGANPLNDLLQSTRDISQITGNASSVTIPTDGPAQKRIKSQQNLPVLPKDTKGALQPRDTARPVYVDPSSTDVSYSPVVRPKGKQGAIQRRLGRLEQAKDYATRAGTSNIDDDLLYSLAGKKRPLNLGEQLGNLSDKYDNAKQRVEDGKQKRQAKASKPTTPTASVTPTVSKAPATPATPATKAPKPANPSGPMPIPSNNNMFSGRVTVGGKEYAGEVNVPDWVRGKQPKEAAKKAGKIRIDNPIDNGNVFDQIKETVNKLKPEGKAGLLAGGVAIGGLGLLGGGALLANNQKIKQVERQRELDRVAERPSQYPQNQLPPEYYY